MIQNDADIVLGLLLHVGGINTASSESKSRVIDSVCPVNKDWGIWQARDNYIGASWIVLLGDDQIHYLTSYSNDGSCWKLYKPCVSARIVETNNSNKYDVTASVISFHDTKHDLAPPALLRIGSNYIYRNASGHTVPLKTSLVDEMLDINNIKP